MFFNVDDDPVLIAENLLYLTAEDVAGQQNLLWKINLFHRRDPESQHQPFWWFTLLAFLYICILHEVYFHDFCPAVHLKGRFLSFSAVVRRTKQINMFLMATKKHFYIFLAELTNFHKILLFVCCVFFLTTILSRLSR